ncbi:hypothetical protein LTR36_006627 [Oleoguttula mirabilis]|uniref:Uncharacterized protein n=1 Tax=Oleoguttula mirabilis TaxID=1507867 RepID=A0AAV9JBQ4_9PEZI|nr:hypothetical protein LTR36_006627 [Oleoguttula mirabilis]
MGSIPVLQFDPRTITRLTETTFGCACDRGQDLYYCMPLVNLKIIRDRSSLQLCRARRDGSYALWAKLNFLLYERMVLFYCTFVAMKYQDSKPVPHDNLDDRFELENENGENEVFGGQIRHGELRHAVRLFKDRSSGVVRLEAGALRGPMQDVPLWTAFITRYAHDPDWAFHEGGSVVSLAADRPPPYSFLAGYEPPRNRRGEILLEFTTSDDARQFMESWAGLCRQASPRR